MPAEAPACRIHHQHGIEKISHLMIDPKCWVFHGNLRFKDWMRDGRIQAQFPSWPFHRSKSDDNSKQLREPCLNLYGQTIDIIGYSLTDDASQHLILAMKLVARHIGQEQSTGPYPVSAYLLQHQAQKLILGFKMTPVEVKKSNDHYWPSQKVSLDISFR